MRRAVGLVLALLANVMMVMANDYYAALGVPRNADANVVSLRMPQAPLFTILLAIASN